MSLIGFLFLFFISSIIFEIISDHLTGYKKAFRDTHAWHYRVAHESTYKFEGFLFAYLIIHYFS